MYDLGGEMKKTIFVILGVIILTLLTTIIPLLFINKFQYEMNLITLNSNTGSSTITYSGKMSYLMNKDDISSEDKKIIGKMFVQGYNMVKSTKEYSLCMVTYFECFVLLCMSLVALFNLILKKGNKYIGVTFLIPSVTLLITIIIKVILYLK